MNGSAKVLLAGLLVANVAFAAPRPDIRELKTVEAAAGAVRRISALPLRGIPHVLLRDAAGVAIVPHLVKAGLVISGSFGRGVVMARLPDGSWADPVFVNLEGRGIGGQVGVESTELVLVFKSRKSLDRALRGKLTLGGDVSVAAGPIGREATIAKDRLSRTDIFSYSRSKGLFVGFSVAGNRIAVDGRATDKFRRAPTPASVGAVAALKQELGRLSIPGCGRSLRAAAATLTRTSNRRAGRRPYPILQPGLCEALMTRLMDGAMGTALLAQGIDPLLAPVSHPRAVAAIHASHAEAGAEALLTATFQANPLTLDDHVEEVCRAAVGLARAARPALVLGSVGPMGWPREFPDHAALRRTLDALDGVDAYLLETCSSPAALEAAAFAYHRAGCEKIWLSLAYHRIGGRLATFSGHGPETYARHAERHEVAALGVNCGKDLTAGDIAEILRIYAENTDLPLFARPNSDAGPLGQLPGIAWLGGCCGMTATHLRTMKETLR